MPRFRFRSCLALSGAALLPLIGVAAEAARFAAPVEPALPESASGMVRMLLALGLVLALVFAAAWLMRRMRMMQGQPAQGIQVISQVSLGARERAVVIRVAGRDLLIGVAPGNVRTLLVIEPTGTNAALPAAVAVPAEAVVPADAALAEGLRPSFRELLRRSLGR